jgi:AbrB family looped-hinge helix DNA binding protein
MVTFNGRITLPPDVRKQLGLRTGDSVEFVEIENGRFAITPGALSSPGPDQQSIDDPRGWIPKLDFSPTEDEPRFRELEESIQ